MQCCSPSQQEPEQGSLPASLAVHTLSHRRRPSITTRTAVRALHFSACDFILNFLHYFLLAPWGPKRTRPLVPRPRSEMRRAAGTGDWTKEEDDRLVCAVESQGSKNWKAISKLVGTRNFTQCNQRWRKSLRPDLVKGKWTSEEDDALKAAINAHGPTCWRAVARSVPGRNTKQCKERWCKCVPYHRHTATDGGGGGGGGWLELRGCAGEGSPPTPIRPSAHPRAPPP